METKPYNLQSPEAIAKEYGGNKQSIARAAQMGMVDPTAAVLAGMFIDRMRGAQAMEQAPQQTVAQQTFAPPMPQGLGATPQAQQMPAMPAPGQMAPAAPPMAPPQGQPAFADGGLTSLYIPDEMYDYAGGGLVAFAKGEEVVNPRKRDRLLKEIAVRFANQPDILQRINTLSNEDMESLLGYGPAVASPIVESPVSINPLAASAPGAMPPAMPPPTDPAAGPMGGGLRLPGQGGPNLGESLFPTPEAAIQQGPTVAPEAAPSGGLAKYVREYQDLLAQIPGAEAPAGDAERRRKENLYGALAQFGFTLAGTPGDLRTAAAKAAKETTPAILEGVKSTRAAEDAERKTRRAEQIEALKGGMGLYGKELDRAAQLEAANIAAGKGTDMSRFVDNFVEAARAKGDTKTSEAVLRQMGGERYLEIFGAAGMRGQAAVAQADIAGQKLSSADYTAATEYAEKQVGFSGSKANRDAYREASRKDKENAKAGNPTNLADQYKQKLATEYLAGLERQRSGGGGGGGAPAGGAPAAGGRTIPSAAVVELKKNNTPLARKQFDQIFGEGAAARALAQ